MEYRRDPCKWLWSPEVPGAQVFHGPMPEGVEHAMLTNPSLQP